MGRTGKLFAHFGYDVQASPDIISLAKPLANGVPIGASLMTERVASILKPGDHGTTFGGNALACAVGETVIKVLGKAGFLESVNSVSKHLLKELDAYKRLYSDHIVEIRGKGLMVGVQFKADFKLPTLIEKAQKNRLLMISAGSNTLRIVPPLIITKQEITIGIERLKRATEATLKKTS